MKFQSLLKFLLRFWCIKVRRSLKQEKAITKLLSIKRENPNSKVRVSPFCTKSKHQLVGSAERLDRFSSLTQIKMHWNQGL